MDNRQGGHGTTYEGDSGQTRQTVADAESNAVPALAEEGMKMEHGPLAAERKAEIEAASKRKMEMMQAEYWRMRNGKQENMACPYCGGLNAEDMNICCKLFAKALHAILDRQAEVDMAANHVRACHKVGLIH